MDIQMLSSKQNLERAFFQLKAASNIQYKKYYRELFFRYEIALEDNLKDLSESLRGGSFRAKQPTRFYVPKPNGLQRPFTLLHIEDQLVYQAAINLFANKIEPKRLPLIDRCVFSNVLNKDRRQDFFFRKWQVSFTRFNRKMEQASERGYVWVGNFDLAAFYDTISHDLAVKSVFPHSGSQEIVRPFRSWLKTWSAERPIGGYEHGIPQGPISSDYLAECLWLQIDKIMYSRYRYIRYCDDVRLFGKTREDVQRAAIELEVLCRNRGLIPQSKKFSINKISSSKKFVVQLPSLIDSQLLVQTTNTLNLKQVASLLKEAVSGRPLQVSDRTKFRYLLYKAGRNPMIRDRVLKVLPRHPEHIDAMLYYLNQYPRSDKLMEIAINYLKFTPYEYVKGQLWEFIGVRANRREMKTLCSLAVEDAKNAQNSFSLRLGACSFLCSAEKQNLGSYASWSEYQDPSLLQALLVPLLPTSCLFDLKLMKRFLKRSGGEPGIMLATEFVDKGINYSHFGISSRQLPRLTQNTFRALRLIKSVRKPIDDVGIILSIRFSLPQWTGWKVVLGNEYDHSRQILIQGDPYFHSDATVWLGFQDVFNDLLVRKTIDYLRLHSMPGTQKTVNTKGEVISIGVLLNVSSPFHRNYPQLAKGLQEAHNRRVTLPIVHPFQLSTGNRSTRLQIKERNRIVAALRKSYSSLPAYLPGV